MRLGQLICDTYMEGCEITDEQYESTLSVVDLAKIPALVEAYDAVGAEALNYVQEDPTFYAQYARAAEKSENYGGNTITVTASTTFEDVDMGDGEFVLYFDMRDGQNNSYLSAPVYFTVEGDDIYVDVDEF